MCRVIRYICIYYNHWIDTSAGGLLAAEGIVQSVVSASELVYLVNLSLKFAVTK